MRTALILTGALVAVASPLSAQTARWNDRPTVTWQDEAPRVRVWIDGARSVSFGTPMRVRFEVSDNAYVTVVRVDDNGRMTILFPYAKNQRATARANFVHDVRNPRLAGQAAFYATDRMGGGYIFALASYAPLDLSGFENRDYDRIGGWSQYTVANRDYARRPDVYIDRFAARVLWDPNTPYDYDVDYYFPGGAHTNMFNSLALCGALYDQFGAHTFGSAFYYDFDNIGFVSMPYRAMCRSYYQQARCMWFGNSYAACNMGTVVATAPGDSLKGKPGDETGDPEVTPNEGVIRGGLFAPTPVPVPVNAGGDPVPVERPIGRFDRPIATDLDDIKSIPARATRKMKEDDAKREANGAPARAGSGFHRTDAANKPGKTSVANSDAPQRMQPPSREPTKSKNVGETRDSRAKGGYGNTGRTTTAGSGYNGPDRVSRPVDKGSSTGAASGGSTPSIQSAPTGDKKKPPQA